MLRRPNACSPKEQEDRRRRDGPALFGIQVDGAVALFERGSESAVAAAAEGPCSGAWRGRRCRWLSFEAEDAEGEGQLVAWWFRREWLIQTISMAVHDTWRPDIVADKRVWRQAHRYAGAWIRFSEQGGLQLGLQLNVLEHAWPKAGLGFWTGNSPLAHAELHVGHDLRVHLLGED